MLKAFLCSIVATAIALPMPALAQLTWGTNGVGVSGTWNSTNTNWYDGTSNVAWVPGDTATFTGTSASDPTAGTITVSGTQVVSALIFNYGASTHVYELGAENAGASFQTGAGGLTIKDNMGVGISVPISGGSVAISTITSTQGALVDIFSANTYTGGTTISAKSILEVFGSNARLGSGGINNNGILEYYSPGSSTYTETNVITGTGTIAIVGSGGPLVLAGANTYSGGTILSYVLSSTSEVENSTVLATVNGTTTIANGPYGTGLLNIGNLNSTNTSTLEDNGTALTLANSLSLSGSIIFASTGNGSLTFDGTTLTTPSTVTLTSTVNLAVNNTTTIADNVSGNFMLTQSGTGTLILTGTSTNTVGMEVASGTLLINNTTGSATGSGTLTVDSGAKLGGTGNISGITNTINGTIQGGAPGLTTSGSLTLTSSGTTTFGSTANLAFNLTAAGSSNKLNVTNSKVLFAGSTLTLNLTDSSTTDYADGLQLILIAADGSPDQFAGISVDGSNRISGLNLVLTGTATNGQQDAIYYGNSYLVLNNGNIDVNILTVPEPKTWVLVLEGMALLLVSSFVYYRVRCSYAAKALVS